LANKNTIFLVGYYGFGNAGDEAILATIVSQLRSRQPEVRIVAASGHPAQTAEAHCIETVAWNDMAAIHHSVQIADLVLIGGGGLFHDYWGVDPDSILTDKHWGVAYYAGPALLATLYHKRVMLYAVGVGPLYSGHGKRLVRLAAQSAQAITVRDPESKQVLRELGIPADRIRLTADPAFAFTLDGDSGGLSRMLDPGFKLTRPVLGVAPRHWGIGVHPDFLEREVAAACDLFLERTGGSVVLVPFQELSGERENDVATAGRILERMQLRDRATVGNGPAIPEHIFSALSECDVVLGMRLHALIFAACSGVPAVALSYDPKIDQIVERLGLEKYSLNVRDVAASRLSEKILHALHDEDLRDTMKQAGAEQRKAAEDNAAIALGLLDTPMPASEMSTEAFDLLARSLYTGSQFSRRVKELEQTAARDSARFAEDREWLLGEQRVLSQQLERASALAEILRPQLAEMTAHYQSAAQRCEALTAEKNALGQENRGLSERLAKAERAAAGAAEVRAQLRAFENGTSALKSTVADLRASLDNAIESRHFVESVRDHAFARLREADEARDWLVKEIDVYAARFRNELTNFRNQRAWQIMLLCRKAYTLLQSSKARFLTWALGLPFFRFGSLAEYDLKFPDITNYVPETYRHTWVEPHMLPGAQPAASAVERPLVKVETPAQGNLYDVVILAIIDFDFRFQRPQQIAAEFARRGHRVFWVSPTRFMPASSSKPYETLPLRDNLWEIHTRSRQPDIYLGELEADVVGSMSEALGQLHRDWTIGAHVLFVQLPFWRRLALKLREMWGSRLLYDCMDDWETFENLGKFNVIEERSLVNECDVLVVTGAELQKKHREQGLRPVLARNGADYPFFSKARQNELLAGVPRPIVGYFGAIADWIDLDLVYEVAKSRPQYSFVMIGQVFGRDISKLESLPNVRMLGNKPYTDIPAYLYNFDACTIPFLINQVTKATDPVKLYEYFSLGKPVVATNMAELQQCGDLLYIGLNAPDFAEKLDKALSEKDLSLPRRRVEFAQANTWSSRVGQVDEAIRESFPLVSIVIVT